MAGNSTIIKNRKAFHDYALEGNSLVAGLCLEGWEVKSLREARVSLKESYVIVQGDELWLRGCQITPLKTAAALLAAMKPTRDKKLLLRAKEIEQLRAAIERKGYTIAPIKLFWMRGNAKLEIQLAKGQKKHDKRQMVKNRDIERDLQRYRKHSP